MITSIPQCIILSFVDVEDLNALMDGLGFEFLS